MFPVKEIREPAIKPSRFEELLQEPLPRFKGELVSKDKQLFAIPKGIRSMLAMPLANKFILE